MTKKPAEIEDVSAKNLSLEELVEHLIEKCKVSLENKTLKVTVRDLLRMRAFREKLSPRHPQGDVTWRDGWGIE
jgi:hypothetical protein